MQRSALRPRLWLWQLKISSDTQAFNSEIANPMMKTSKPLLLYSSSTRLRSSSLQPATTKTRKVITETRPKTTLHKVSILGVESLFVDGFSCTPPRTARISGLKSQVLKPSWVKNDSEKWSRFFFFEIEWALSELLLPIAKKLAQKDWIGLAG